MRKRDDQFEDVYMSLFNAGIEERVADTLEEHIEWAKHISVLAEIHVSEIRRHLKKN